MRPSKLTAQHFLGEFPERQIWPPQQGVTQLLGAIAPVDHGRIDRGGRRTARACDDVNAAGPGAHKNRLKPGQGQRISHRRSGGEKAVRVRRQA